LKAQKIVLHHNNHFHINYKGMRVFVMTVITLLLFSKTVIIHSSFWLHQQTFGHYKSNDGYLIAA